MDWWVARVWEQNQVLLIAWVFWVIISIVLHELGHGWAAIRVGDRTPIDSGHMTWNPVVHMGVPSLVVFAFTGLAWGAMPVDPTRFRGRHADAQVAAAGPAMNLGLAVVCHLLLAIWIAAAGGYWTDRLVAPDALFENMQTFLRVGGVINVALLLLNVLPAPPLDGSRIVASFVPAVDRLFSQPYAPIIGMIAVVLIMTRAGDELFGAAFTVSEAVTDALLERVAPGAARSP